jgi:hypothetical protein
VVGTPKTLKKLPFLPFSLSKGELASIGTGFRCVPKCGGFVVEQSRQAPEWEEFLSMTRRSLSTRM